MEASFLDFFKRFSRLTYSDLVQLYKITRIKKYKAGEIIIREGDDFKYAIGIIKGIIRTYMIKSSGEEITVRLAAEKDFTGAANCLINNKPSSEYLEAIENCIVLEFDVNAFRVLSQDNIRLLHFWNDAIQSAFSETVERIVFYLAKTPEERYRKLLEENPKLVLRVPQKYLASYIGVTTVSLSRIRSRLKA